MNLLCAFTRRRCSARILLSAAAVAISLTAQAATEVKYPADAPVWNVRDYGAIGDGVADDTAAFAAAADAALRMDRYGAIAIIYVPNGVYKITNTIEAKITSTGTWGGWRAGFHLQGESEDGAILRLPNSSPGFTNASTPKPVIKTGSEQNSLSGLPLGEGNQAFRHYIRNLTVDIGSGNPGAVGIDFLVNNRGGVYNVTIKSSDANRLGHTGLQMDRSWPGPGIIKDVTVIGFETGISMRVHPQYGMTFENITLQNQRAYGFYIKNNTAAIRNLTSTNSVPAIFLETNRAHLALIDAVFNGGATANNAITSTGKIYARNIRSTGYGMVIQDNSTSNRDVTGGASQVTVAEYKSHGEYKEFASSISGAVQMPVRETPEYNTLDFAQWRSVAFHGATPNNASNDDLAGIQAAIDSGNPVVYLPRGKYEVSNTIVIRGSVRKFIGLAAEIVRKTGFPTGAPLIRYDGGTAEGAILQYLRLDGPMQHNSAQPLTVVNSDIRGLYTNTVAGTGDLFLEDTCGPNPLHIAHPQYVWARQLNIEFLGTSYYGNYVTNDGGFLWTLGYKTEGTVGPVLANVDGWMEVLGGFIYPNNGNVTTFPMVLNEEGQLSLTYKKDDLTGNNYNVHVRDIRGGVTSDFLKTEAGDSNNTALYSGATASYQSVYGEVVLNQYNFTGSSLNSADTDSASTASTFQNGSGYTVTSFGTSGDRIVSGAGVAGYTPAQDSAAGEYFKFTNAPVSGAHRLYLTSVSLKISRSSSSPDRFTLYGIPNGGPSSGQLIPVLNAVTVGTTGATHTADLSGTAFQGINGVEFRAIFHGANQGAGNNRVDDVVLKGVAAP